MTKQQLLKAHQPEVLPHAYEIMKQRYLRVDKHGEPLETPAEMFYRVAKAMAKGDEAFIKKGEDKAKVLQEITEKFYKKMADGSFTPGGRILFEAGNEHTGQLAHCFVIPIEDSMRGIFTALADAAEVQQKNGGTGFNFSQIRPKGDMVKNIPNVAAGPIHFLKTFDQALSRVLQGSKRHGANMGILNVDHPDIEAFIELKDEGNSIKNFNISVGVTDDFMEKVRTDSQYELINPRTGKPTKTLRARYIFDKLVERAWRCADPGIIFLDRIQDGNMTPHIGVMDATNPCGEQPLLPYESCNLGQIILKNHVKPKTSKKAAFTHTDVEFDWDRLATTAHMAVHFMDNMITVNNHALESIRENTLKTRKTGIGVMGYAQLLFRLGIPYGSQEAIDFGEQIMQHIEEHVVKSSVERAKRCGVFPAWKGSRWDTERNLKVRNATMTTIAPTGTISLGMGTSSGIEPVFSLVIKRRVFFEAGSNNESSRELMIIDDIFERVAKERGFYSEELMERIAQAGTIQGFTEIPEDVRHVFKTTFDITPEQHVKTQAAFQTHTHNAVSKTINLPHSATIHDVRQAYVLAYETGCKGVTIYRDGSKQDQVLNTTAKKEASPASDATTSTASSVPTSIEIDAPTPMSTESASGTTHPLLTANALQVLGKRALRKDENGAVIETPHDLFKRVAKVMAAPDAHYDAYKDTVQDTEQAFFDMLNNLEFVPGQALRNAGDRSLTNSACLVLPIEDSIEGIMQTLKENILAHKATCGTGFNFSALRSRNALVGSSGELASGPVAFMKAFNAAQDTIRTKGGRSQGSMAILNVDHPDIEEFISVKDDLNEMQHFNISVGVSDQFMEALRNDADWNLVDPHTKAVTKTLKAKALWDRLVQHAWVSGDPGLIFLDAMERTNPTPSLGKLEATNPCGEQPLIPYETCNLGSIVLSRMLKPASGNRQEIDWEKLARTVAHAVHFLDNTIDAGTFPIEKVRDMSRKTRRIGLGVMGFADMLIELGVPYNSDQAVQVAKQVMKFVHEHAHAASQELGERKGSFPAFEQSVWKQQGRPAMRNSAVTTIAPTGYTSIVAGCSSGIEPLFALAFRRENSMGGEKQIEVNSSFERIAKERGFYSETLMDTIAETGSCKGLKDVPQDIQDLFVVSYDIDPEWDIKIQGAFQLYTDNAVSKTINFPNHATAEDIERVYRLAYELGCKGITIYRDGSKEQVLSVGTKKTEAGATQVPGQASDAPREAVRPTPIERPDVVKGATYRLKTSYGKLYVTINSDDHGKPFEVFATIGKSGGFFAAKSESICRMISLALRSGIPAEQVIKELKGVRGPMPGFTKKGMILSIPDAIAKLLEEHIQAQQQQLPISLDENTNAHIQNDPDEKNDLEDQALAQLDRSDDRTPSSSGQARSDQSHNDQAQQDTQTETSVTQQASVLLKNESPAQPSLLAQPERVPAGLSAPSPTSSPSSATTSAPPSATSVSTSHSISTEQGSISTEQVSVAEKPVFTQGVASESVADTGMAPECPECANIMHFQEGCMMCHACGFSKCG